MKTFKTKEELRDWAMYIVPDDAKWIAVDASTSLMSYRRKPDLSEEHKEFQIFVGYDYLCDVSISFPWQESLIEIEHPIDLTKYIGKVVKVRKVIDRIGIINLDILNAEMLADTSLTITPLKHEDIES